MQGKVSYKTNIATAWKTLKQKYGELKVWLCELGQGSQEGTTQHRLTSGLSVLHCSAMTSKSLPRFSQGWGTGVYTAGTSPSTSSSSSSSPPSPRLADSYGNYGDSRTAMDIIIIRLLNISLVNCKICQCYMYSKVQYYNLEPQPVTTWTYTYNHLKMWECTSKMACLASSVRQTTKFSPYLYSWS